MKFTHFSSVTFVRIGVQKFPVGFKRFLQHVYFNFKVLDAIYLTILLGSVISPQICVSAIHRAIMFLLLFVLSGANYGINFNESRVLNRVPCHSNHSQILLRKHIWFWLLIVFFNAIFWTCKFDYSWWAKTYVNVCQSGFWVHPPKCVCFSRCSTK